VNFYIHNIHNSLLRRQQEINSKYFQRFKANIVEILAKFLRFIARKVSTRPCEFNVRKGLIRQNKVSSSCLLISVRDPFISYLNHGASLQDRRQYHDIVQECTDLLEAASEGSALQYMYYIPE